ncbi:MAG TPA: SDR family oxidoreductase [Longimicrobium sp.]|nr:SDR family oxidoreductase [Longimicrobium sp.]
MPEPHDSPQRTPTGAEIAIIGMAGRFPGAPSVARLWENLVAGVESVVSFGEAELLAAGVPAAALADPAYVRAGGWLQGADLFDAPFFGLTPREAETTDPQQRLFLECAWEALEHAGCAPAKFPGLIGVFAGVSPSVYLMENLLPNRALLAGGAAFDVMVGNDKDYLATRVSYKLGLRGPSITVQTACSTSLVAVHLACRALLGGECDAALAGGVSLQSVEPRGYPYREGGILSPDGHCRAFDEEAAGTLSGSGVGVVVLKRLEDALADGDTIHAVILGSAINNDGAAKVGYMAPGADGQAAVIADALALAGVDARAIGYVEAHGTATPLGDPVEVQALTRAYRAHSADTGFCALGSIKTNIGHLDAAAGVAGLIKATLAVEHATIPASLHFHRPNPRLELERTPFTVAAETRAWTGDGPRRAGVSSFGIGGTNAHAVLEQAPDPAPRTGEPRPVQLVLLSARTQAALEAARANLADHLEDHPEIDLADAACTLQLGRTELGWRAAVAATSAEDAILALDGASGVAARDRPVAFLFPGQGAQHVRMAAGVYASEPVFRRELDHCAELLRPELGFDLREALYPPAAEDEAAAARLGQTAVTQPALFAVEYALAKLWMSWGVRPDAMLGHSVGEFVAAALAGVFEPDDALRLVAARGRLMQALPAGAMLAVFLPEDELLPLLPPSVSLAAVNGPATCVVSGPADDVCALEERLSADDVELRRLHTSHAFHSEMMDPAVAPFRELVREEGPRAPTQPYVSCVTGTWITAEQAMDPDYWARQLRDPVRFRDGVEALLETPGRALIEVGPGRTLGTLVPRGGSHVAIPSLPHPKDAHDDAHALADALGRAWSEGVSVDWNAYAEGRGGRRIPLPTYPFERQRYYVDPPRGASRPAAASADDGKRADVGDWFNLPSWRRSPLLPAVSGDGFAAERWLVFADAAGVGDAVAERLRDRGASVATVVVDGEAEDDERPTMDSDDGERLMLDPRAGQAAYDRLVSVLAEQERAPSGVVHCWSVGEAEDFDAAQAYGAASVIALANALAGHVDGGVRLFAGSTGVQEVDGRDAVDPAKATLLGPLKVIPQEHPDLACRAVDLDPAADPDASADAVLAELAMDDGAAEVAWRGGRRWVQTFDAVRVERAAGRPAALAERSVWLITGGLGQIGRALGVFLAREARARLVLVARTPLPPREQWDDAVRAGGREAERVAAVREMEALGAEVMVAAADVADEAKMNEVITAARARWGRIDAVVHAAAPSAEEAFTSLADTGPAELEAQLAPKARGTMVLDRVLGYDPPATAIAFSSLSSVLGGLRFGAYAAANAWLDAHALASPLPWVAVGWDGWHFGAGEAGGHSMTVEEGLDAFARILSLPRVPRIVVSTGDLEARLRRVRADASPSPDTAAPPAATHARPSLRTAYAAPQTELEVAVAQVWEEMLGTAQVGVDDDFFELGGHSLLGTRVIARLRKSFAVDIPVDAIFRAPTVATLAAVVEERLLAAVEAMSEEEALELA